MKRYRMLRLYGAGSLIIPAAAVWIWQTERWADLLFAVWVIAAAWLWIAADRKEQAQRHERTVQTLQTTAIRTLNHHRHDWMNDLQVLYGYIRMNKPDKSAECVEKIRERMAVESRIAKLGVPSLVMFAQSFRTVTSSVMLRFELSDELQLAELPLDAEAVAESLIDILTAYRFALKPGAGDPAKLTVALDRNESALQVGIVCEGDILNAKELQDKIRQRIKKSPLRAERLDPEMKELAFTAALGG